MSSELERIKQLAGLTEGPKWDAFKSGASKAVSTTKNAVTGHFDKRAQKKTDSLQKIADFAKRTGLADSLSNYIRSTLLETVTEEIDHPDEIITDKAVLKIFNALEQELATNDTTEPTSGLELTGDVDHATGKPKARVTREQVEQILSTLMERSYLGRQKKL